MHPPTSRVSTAMTMTESKLKPRWGHRRINIKPMYHLIGTHKSRVEQDRKEPERVPDICHPSRIHREPVEEWASEREVGTKEEVVAMGGNSPD